MEENGLAPFESSSESLNNLEKNGGEMTREVIVLGAKRLGYRGETTRVENRGETTRGKRPGGGTSWG